VAALAVAVLFFVVGAGIRLLVGPISLGPLSGQISEALDQALPGITVKYDQAAIEWSRDEGKVNLVVLGARVFDGEGRIIAQAPQADIDLAAGPFIQGKIVVQRITLVGVQVTLVRTADGVVRLGVENNVSETDIIQRITDAINKGGGGPSQLKSFAIRDARLAFQDQTTGVFIVSPRADVKIATQDSSLLATLDADIEISGAASRVTGEMILPPKAGPVRGDIAISHLDIAALGRNAKMFHFLRSVGMLADLRASFAVEGTQLLTASASVNAAGTARFVGVREPIKVRAMHLAARYDRGDGRITIVDSAVDSDQVHAHIVGTADLIRDNTNAISRIAIALTADSTALAMPGTFSQPVTLPMVQFKGGYVPATHDILIDSLNTSGGALKLATAGHITLVDNNSPVMEIKGRIEALALRDLLHYWPIGIGEGARTWLAKNVFTGNVGPLVYETHLAAGALDGANVPDGALLMTFPINNAEINFVTGLTHATAVNGNAKLTGNTFDVQVGSGRIGPLVVSKARGTIANLSISSAPADITAHVAGTVADVLRLTDMKPLGYATRFGINPATTAGSAGLDLHFIVPMRRDVSVDELSISIKAATTGFALNLGKNTRLSDGAILFDINNDRLHAVGAASVATSRLNLDWTEAFHTRDPITTRVAIKGNLDDAGRNALGMGLSEFLTGTAPVDATLTGHRGKLVAADATVDLTPAVLGFDLLGINKPQGVAASGHVLAKFGAGNTIQSADVRVTGPSVQATATATFDSQGSLAMLSAPSVRSGASNDFAINYARNGNSVDITLRGHSLDGTRFAHSGSNTGKPAPRPANNNSSTDFTGPFHINARLDRVVLRDNVAIAPLALDVSGNVDRYTGMTLNGTLGKGGTLGGTIVPAGGDRKLTLVSSDAGMLMRGFFGFASMRGGKLDLQGTMHGDGSAPVTDPSIPDLKGTLKLRDFKLLNQPFLARLFTAGSLMGFGNLMQGQGIGVDELTVPFSMRNGVIAVHDARATGPAIGVSAEGYIDRPQDKLSIKGTLVPLYGINSVLGMIPLVGTLLTSKPGEGIIGLSYTATGDADEPDINVNPLSIVTPGILRRIFEGKMPDAANAPSNAPPSVAVTPQAHATQD
jgi:hypothetical protein